MAITAFTSSNLKTLRAEIDTALGVVAKRHGIKLALGKITYTGPTFTAKVEGVAEGGVDPAVSLAANMLGIDLTNAAGMEIVGYRSRATRAWVVQHADGARYVYSDAAVKSMFPRAKADA